MTSTCCRRHAARRVLTCLASAASLLAAAVTAHAQAAPPTAIPLREGLTIVTALAERVGDYESIKRITGIGAGTIDITYTADAPNEVKASRQVRLSDQNASHEYRRVFFDDSSGVLPDSTALGASAEVITELRTTGATRFRTQPAGDSLLATFELARVEATPVSLPVIVNDKAVMLPTIHARGTVLHDAADFYFLDDPKNPLCLRYRIGGDTLNVIKIAFPPEPAAAAPPSPIEQALEKTGRATVYGIYFDFASARIKPESEPVLRDIAAVMAANPTWTLNVEGHTDSIGGDARNMDLSKRRAAAVKNALVTRHHIEAARLATSGFGASRPVDTNETLEGRAKNRRVELVRP
jgi:outer membrane protein OmpA-like peptidoglycan-associated protein